jgi:uncharacterized protein YdhG (YjbR/CyaY superfamily)
MGTVGDYVEALPDPVRERIRDAYAVAREQVPDAEETLKYAMPALALEGAGVISIMSTRKHIGVYPYSSETVARVLTGDGLPGVIGSTKGSLHFALDAPLPPEAIRAIVAARLAELGR